MSMSNGSRNVNKSALLFLIGAAFAAIFFSPLRHHLTVAAARDFVTSTRGHAQSLWWAPPALIGAYGIGCIFAIPATVFIVFAGAVWARKPGVVYAMCVCMLASTA